MSYEIKLPNNNVEYFFDVKDMPDLSHVVYIKTDEHDNLLFFNVEINKIVLITKKQFSFFYSKFLKKEIRSELSYKDPWLPFLNKFEAQNDELKIESMKKRLLKTFYELPFMEQKLAIIEFAEGKKMKATLSEEEQTLIKKFRTLGPFEREAILIQIDALAGEKSFIKK